MSVTVRPAGRNYLDFCLSVTGVIFAVLLAACSPQPDAASADAAANAAADAANTAADAANVAAAATSAEATAVASGQSAAPAKGAQTKWEYSEEKDAMRGTSTKFARLTSENELSLAEPYGTHSATLVLRRRSTDGLQIMLSVNGQFLCSEYSQNHVAVKFDQGPIQKFSCSEPEDATTGVLFINSPSKFVAEAKKAKTVIIEAEYFENGRQQLTFDVHGLEF